MSALGQKQTFAMQYVMSALPPIADICSALAHVRFVPIADIPSLTRSPHRRVRAAATALPFEHPKLSVTASLNGEDFADQMDKAFQRSAKVIEAEPIRPLPNRARSRSVLGGCVATDNYGYAQKTSN